MVSWCHRVAVLPLATDRGTVASSPHDDHGADDRGCRGGNELVLLFSKHRGQENGRTCKRYWGPMLPFHLDAIQHKIDQWEGDGASQYQIRTFDLSSFEEIINVR
jgi:hypothetical protein